MVIVYSFTTLIFYLPLSFGFALSALIGNSLGTGNIELAKRYVKFIFSICQFIVFIFVLLILLYSRNIVEFYTKDEVILEQAQMCLFAYTITFCLDSFQVLFQGLIKGLGL
jgi:Na+-driven multidrug efflux pump